LQVFSFKFHALLTLKQLIVNILLTVCRTFAGVGRRRILQIRHRLRLLRCARYGANSPISTEQRHWRAVLQGAMRRHGFANYFREWWHYSFSAPEPRAYDFAIVPSSSWRISNVGAKYPALLMISNIEQTKVYFMLGPPW
jgi:hypothetical protein